MEPYVDMIGNMKKMVLVVEGRRSSLRKSKNRLLSILAVFGNLLITIGFFQYWLSPWEPETMSGTPCVDLEILVAYMPGLDPGLQELLTGSAP